MLTDSLSCKTLHKNNSEKQTNSSSAIDLPISKMDIILKLCKNSASVGDVCGEYMSKTVWDSKNVKLQKRKREQKREK